MLNSLTFVEPTTAMFSVKGVSPATHPHMPASRLPNPSTRIPAQFVNELIQWRVVRRLSVCLSVRLSVCKLLRKSLLLADKWPDRHQTFTRKLCCRKDDRAMRPIYGCHENFLDSLCPRLLFPKIFMGFCSHSPCECAYKI